MAEKKFPSKDVHGNDISLHRDTPIVTGSKEIKDSPLKKAAKVFLAEDIEQVTGSLVDDYVKPRAKSFGLDMVKKAKEFIFDSFTDLARKFLFGSNESSNKTGYYNGSKVNYVSYYNGSSSDYYSNGSYSRNGVYPNDPRDRVKRIAIPSYGKAVEVLNELRSYIKAYGKTTIADYYQAVDFPVSKIDFSYGWVNGMLENIHITNAGSDWVIELPRPVEFN